MSKRKAIDPHDTVQADNTAMRIPVILALDTSGSMGANGGYLALNEGVSAFFETCKADELNRCGFDVCIVTFGGDGVKMKQEFRPIWNQEDVPVFEKPENGPCGTPLGQAVDTAIRALESRREMYRTNKPRISHTRRAFLIIVTDGQSTEIMREAFSAEEEFRKSCAMYEASAERARELQREGRLEVACVGVGKQNYRRLGDFSLYGEVLHAKDFSQFGILFETLSAACSYAVTPMFGELDGTNDRPQSGLLKIILEFVEDEGIEGIDFETFEHDDN